MAHIEEHEYTSVLVYEVGGFRYSFCVEGFDKSKLDWLCCVIDRQAQAIHSRAVEAAEKEVMSRIHKALGLK